MSEVYTPQNPLDAYKFPVPSGPWMWSLRANKLDGTLIIYTAYAQSGSAESKAAWLIAKHTYDAAGDIIATNYVDGIARFQHVYDSGLSAPVSAATEANPCNITVSSLTLSDGRIIADGDLIYFSDVGGMTELNGNYYVVSGLAGSAFNLIDTDGVNVNSTGFTTYTTGGECHLPEFANYTYS